MQHCSVYQDQLTISIVALFLWYLHNGLHQEVACLIFFFMLSFSKQNLILEFFFEVSNYEQHCNSNKGMVVLIYLIHSTFHVWVDGTFQFTMELFFTEFKHAILEVCCAILQPPMNWTVFLVKMVLEKWWCLHNFIL